MKHMTITIDDSLIWILIKKNSEADNHQMTRTWQNNFQCTLMDFQTINGAEQHKDNNSLF